MTKLLTPVAITGNVTRLRNLEGHFLGKQQNEKMLCLYGKSGTGKTTACKYLAAQQDAFYFHVRPNASPYGFISALAKTLGVTPGRGFDATLDKVADHLEEERPTLIFDEADRLFESSAKHMRTCRYLHDSANILMVFSGIPALKPLMESDAALAGRTHFEEFASWSEEDCQQVATKRCKHRVQKDLLKKIFRRTKGNGRLVVRCLQSIDEHAEVAGLKEIGLAEWVDANGNPLPLLPD